MKTSIRILLLLITAILPLSSFAQAEDDPYWQEEKAKGLWADKSEYGFGRSSYGTIDPAKKFVDRNTHADCYIQPNGSVFIDIKTAYEKTNTVAPETLVMPETVVDSVTGKTDTVRGTVPNAFVDTTAMKDIKVLRFPKTYTTLGGEGMRGSTSSTSIFKSLEEVHGPGVQYIGEKFFANAYNLVKVDFPEVKEMKGSIFSGCRILKSVSFPKWEHALLGFYFQGCTNLEEVYAPKLVYLGPDMFEHSGLKKFIFPSVTEVDQKFFHGSNESPEVLELPLLKDATDLWLKYITFTTVNLNSVESLREGFFDGQTNLKTVHLDALKHGRQLFKNCTSIRHISLPSFVGNTDVDTDGNPIGNTTDMFIGCDSLRYLSLPSVDTLSENTLNDCHKLDTLLIPKATVVDDESLIHSFYDDDKNTATHEKIPPCLRC